MGMEPTEAEILLKFAETTKEAEALARAMSLKRMDAGVQWQMIAMTVQNVRKLAQSLMTRRAIPQSTHNALLDQWGNHISKTANDKRLRERVAEAKKLHAMGQ